MSVHTATARRGRRIARASLGLGITGGLALLLLIAFVFSLGIGAVTIPPGQVIAIVLARLRGLTVASTQAAIVWDLRLARALLAVVIGGGLAAAGASYQALFRNPLADPFIIGASGGAALGATLAIILGTSLVMPGAFAGALAAVALVYTLAQSSGRSSTVHLLLAGAALSTLLSAMVSLLMFLNDRSLLEVFAWLMGGLSGRSWPHLRLAAPAIALGVLALWLLARPLDALACGEETAHSLGLNLRWARRFSSGCSNEGNHDHSRGLSRHAELRCTAYLARAGSHRPTRARISPDRPQRGG